MPLNTESASQRSWPTPVLRDVALGGAGEPDGGDDGQKSGDERVVGGFMATSVPVPVPVPMADPASFILQSPVLPTLYSRRTAASTRATPTWRAIAAAESPLSWQCRRAACAQVVGRFHPLRHRATIVPMPEPTAHIPATRDEELLCCLGPAFPALAGSDPDRVARIRDEVASGFAALTDVAHAVSIFGSARHHPPMRPVRDRPPYRPLRCFNAVRCWSGPQRMV